MKILFCRVSYMKYYRGANDDDVPYNGGSFVEDNGYGHEEYNFSPILFEGESEEECFGFFEPSSSNGTTKGVCIENIAGCSAMKDEPRVDDVLVVWCATSKGGDSRGNLVSNITVVGWYEHATVYRNLQEWTAIFEDSSEEKRFYNVRAKAKNCFLLPVEERNVETWRIPSSKKTKSIGFGRAMVWYPKSPAADALIDKVTKGIEKFKEERGL